MLALAAAPKALCVSLLSRSSKGAGVFGHVLKKHMSRLNCWLAGKESQQNLYTLNFKLGGIGSK